MQNEFVQEVLQAYQGILELALPICFFIAACNISINCIVAAFTGGRLHLGGK